MPGAPKFTAVPRCGYVSVQGVEPYFLCTFFDGNKDIGEPWRVPAKDVIRDLDNKPLNPEHPEVYICTTDEGYASIENFKKAVKRYALTHCK